MEKRTISSSFSVWTDSHMRLSSKTPSTTFKSFTVRTSVTQRSSAAGTYMLALQSMYLARLQSWNKLISRLPNGTNSMHLSWPRWKTHSWRSSRSMREEHWILGWPSHIWALTKLRLICENLSFKSHLSSSACRDTDLYFPTILSLPLKVCFDNWK